jgi:hypothetical protein
MTKEEFDTTSTENLICPYCGAEQEEAREQEDWGTPETWECCDCTRDFIYTTETVLKFTSEDLGEYLEDKIEQEQSWFRVLEKDYNSIKNDFFSDADKTEKARIKMERTSERIGELKKRLRTFELQKPTLVSNCCGVAVIENTDLCSQCKDHCGTELEGAHYA